MNKIAFDKKVLLILFAALFAVVSLSLFVNNSLQSIVDKVSEESKLDEKVVLLKGLMVNISDAENAVKSYSLTKDTTYLSDYNNQINSVDDKLFDLGALVEFGTIFEQNLPKIDSLVTKKFIILDELLMVQSQRSSDLILNKVLEKVEDVNKATEGSSTRTENETVTTDSAEEEKFFKRLLGNRKKKKEEKNEALADTLGMQDVEAVVDRSFTKIDTEIEALREQQSEVEIGLKMKELTLIQADKEIMDEISALVNTLEQEDKKERAAKIQFAESQRSSTKTLIILFCIVACLLLLIAGYVIYLYVKRNDAYKKALRAAKNITDFKNTQITESINYAKRIQTAIMPDTEKIALAFPNSFIFYRPKDIVAGDFYWMIETEQEVFIAVADCTGHGVPGAMVSVASSAALNRSVKEFGLRKPSEILDKSREIIIETFDKGSQTLYDGMDISLVRVDKNSNQMQYAGANNSLYIIRNKELIEIKADKQPVARFYKAVPFTNHIISVEKNDFICLFTDGLPDQFGGPRRKKYLYKRFRDLLIASSDQSPAEQEAAIDAAFKTWKGGLEQIDDICIIGIRF
ncbi:MAG: SpoIIE family protein phosphatase [Crocinitomix sp.]|nr:SpoIIE family protein phosphatase [Crocinitomix sp.]